MTILYTCCFAKVEKSRRMAHRTNTRDNKLIALRLSLLLITDLVSWLPFCYVTFNALFSNQNRKVDAITLQFVGIFALPLNAALNPFLYTATNISVLKKMLFCACKRNVVQVKPR